MVSILAKRHLMSRKCPTCCNSGFKKYSYEEILQKLGLTTLEVRRQRGDLIECYKILTGKENINPHQFFHVSDNIHGLRDQSQSIPWQIPSRYQEKLLQSNGPQWLEQSSSECHQRNFGKLVQESPTCSLEDQRIWTIKAQPAGVHNFTSTSTRTNTSTSSAPVDDKLIVKSLHCNNYSFTHSFICLG